MAEKINQLLTKAKKDSIKESGEGTKEFLKIVRRVYLLPIYKLIGMVIVIGVLAVLYLLSKVF